MGHGLPWGEAQRRMAAVKRELYRAPALDDQVVAAVEELLSGLSGRLGAGLSLAEAQAELSAGSTFRRLCERLEGLGWDDLHLAVLMALAPSAAR